MKKKNRRRRTEDIPIQFKVLIEDIETILPDDVLSRILARNGFQPNARLYDPIKVQIQQSPVWTIAVIKRNALPPAVGVAKRCLSKGQKDKFDSDRAIKIASSRAFDAYLFCTPGLQDK